MMLHAIILCLACIAITAYIHNCKTKVQNPQCKCLLYLGTCILCAYIISILLIQCPNNRSLEPKPIATVHNAKCEGGKTIQWSSNKHTLHSSSEHNQLMCLFEDSWMVLPPSRLALCTINYIHCKNVRVVFKSSVVISVASYKHPVSG